MTRVSVLSHEFVEFIPDQLQDGRIYISIKYATAVHKCCCGCGNEVVTPIAPTGWALTFDGKTISLHPSIGGWSHACKSHYWISHNQVQWAEQWSQARIQAGRAHDARLRQHFYEETEADSSPNKLPSSKPAAKASLWTRFTSWLRS